MYKVVITLIMLMVLFRSIRADEPRAFCGKSADGWITVLREPTRTENERRFAVWALGCLGREAQQAVPDLLDAVRQGRFSLKPIDALMRIGTEPHVIVSILSDRLVKTGDHGGSLLDPNTQHQVVRIGQPAVPMLVVILNGSDDAMRVGAAKILGKMRTDARAAVPDLIRMAGQAADGPNGSILSQCAVQALGLIGPQAGAAVSTLDDLLQKPGDYKSFEVVMALDRIGFPPVEKLVAAFLDEGDWLVAYDLAWLGSAARRAAPALRQALADKRPKVRVGAAVALAYIEPVALDGIPVLIEALNRPDDAIDASRVPAALGQFGPTARVALPALVDQVKQGTSDEAVLRALIQIDPKGRECVPALMLALDSDDRKFVNAAGRDLGLLGPRAKEAVASLTAILTRDFNGEFAGCNPRVSAIYALGRIGPDAKSAIPGLIAALKYREGIGADFDEFFNHAEDRVAVAVAAARVLGSFKANAVSAVPALIEAVQTVEGDGENRLVQQAAALALGEMGPAAKAAVPVLRRIVVRQTVELQDVPELTVALYQLAPDGTALAEEWLTAHSGEPMKYGLPYDELEARAMVLGAMGRASFETDCLTRSYLEQFDSMISNIDKRAGQGFESLQWWFEKIGRLGYAGRLAIPRLRGLCEHINPSIRIWAGEALKQVTAAQTKVSASAQH